MNKQWEQFLLSNNAVIENNTVINFGLSLEEEQTAYTNIVLADLSHYSIIEASGDDVIDFLQGQLTHDIKLVSDSTGQLSAYCNPKGRIISNFRIFKREDHYLLRMRSDLIEATLKRLRMFVMRSKVTLSDSSDTLSRMGIGGENATNKLTSLFKNLPGNADDSCTEDGVTVIKLPGSVPRYEAYGALEKIKSLWQGLQKDAVLIGENSWNILTIRSGIPEIVSQTVEAFVPQMVNLQAINSLSFTKGCYPGQEVVARMHYLGKLKRRLFIGTVEDELLPEPGQAIMTKNAEPKKAGQVVTASWTKDKKIEFLAVLQIEIAENNALQIESENGSKHGGTIQFIDLPYTLEIEEKS